MQKRRGFWGGGGNLKGLCEMEKRSGQRNQNVVNGRGVPLKRKEN